MDRVGQCQMISNNFQVCGDMQRPVDDPAEEKLEEESDGEVEEHQGGDLVPPLEWRGGGGRPSGQEDVVQFVEYLEEMEEEVEEEVEEDLVSPLVEKKEDPTTAAALKKTRKRSQV